MGVANIEDVADVTSKTTDIGSNQQPGRLNNKNGDLSKQHANLTNQVWDLSNIAEDKMTKVWNCFTNIEDDRDVNQLYTIVCIYIYT